MKENGVWSVHVHMHMRMCVNVASVCVGIISPPPRHITVLPSSQSWKTPALHN